MSTPDTIAITRDMAESLVEHFDRFENDGVVEIFQNHQGLWFWNGGQPLFLGLGRKPDNGATGSKSDAKKRPN